MKKTVMGLVLGLGFSGAVWAQTVPPAPLVPNPQIESTISRQIDAFQKDDFATAFGFASPGIRSLFGTPENFGMMVRKGYPMVWRPSQVQFGPLREIKGALWQQVTITDSTGKQFIAEYRMERLGTEWRIAGVQVVPAPGAGA